MSFFRERRHLAPFLQGGEHLLSDVPETGWSWIVELLVALRDDPKRARRRESRVNRGTGGYLSGSCPPYRCLPLPAVSRVQGLQCVFPLRPNSSVADALSLPMRVPRWSSSSSTPYGRTVTP